LVATSYEKTVCSGAQTSKIARFVSICFIVPPSPTLTFVNCEGFAPLANHDFRGGIREVAKLAHVYAEATTPKIAVIAGKAYGSAFITLAGRAANADYTVAWPSAAISALSPETAVAFLEGDKITADKPAPGRSRICGNTGQRIRGRREGPYRRCDRTGPDPFRTDFRA
jgi:acetyl-CoA carboxylase carboxyltransferase component